MEHLVGECEELSMVRRGYFGRQKIMFVHSVNYDDMDGHQCI